MKLYGATMLHNEADLGESFARHSLAVLDGLAGVDHGSTDGTSELLAALVAEGLRRYSHLARDETLPLALEFAEQLAVHRLINRGPER